MEKKTITLYKKRFDDIRHEENGIEFWYARELMELLAIELTAPAVLQIARSDR